MKQTLRKSVTLIIVKVAVFQKKGKKRAFDIKSLSGKTGVKLNFTAVINRFFMAKNES